MPTVFDGDQVLERVLELLPPGATADARWEWERFTTMRFANGWIHQPHIEQVASLSVRAEVEGRLGIATTLDLRPESLQRTVDEAVALARCAPVERTFPGFPGGGTIAPSTPYSTVTARLTPEEAGRWTEQLLEGARASAPEGRISGVAHFGDTRLHVANTSGRRARTRRSLAAARVLVERLAFDPPSTGWAEAAHFDHRKLRPREVGVEAGERAARAAPVAIEPGAYRVVLDGSAAAKLVSELGYLGFGARGAEDGWSCLARRRGRRIAPEGFSITDDGRSVETLPQGIDFEGTAKRRTPLVRDGIAGGAVSDLLSGARRRSRTTGHAWPPEAPWGEFGAVPQNTIVSRGKARDLDELVRETRRGILVTRFHYVRTVDESKAILTGMTRDGTYKIERGEITEPVRNLRFTESVLTALGGLELWGRDRRCFTDDDERGAVATTAAPMLTRRFRFTSATLF